MKLAWITDPHLDFMRHSNIVAFATHIKNLKLDAVVITGDISNGRNFSSNIGTFATFCPLSIYYVLGNHDFYFTSFEQAKEVCVSCDDDNGNLHFLESVGVVELTPDTALVGSSGFYDGLAGDPDSRFQLSDFSLISNLKQKPFQIREICKKYSESMVESAKSDLVKAANQYKNVYFATHVPPFTESCWYQGKKSSPDALPWFTNLTFGKMLSDVASEYTDTNFTVLCGHTHGAGEYKHFDNLMVYTGAAEYEYPAIWKILEI